MTYVSDGYIILTPGSISMERGGQIKAGIEPMTELLKESHAVYRLSYRGFNGSRCKALGVAPVFLAVVVAVVVVVVIVVAVECKVPCFPR